MKKTKIIPKATTGAAATLALVWLGATGHFGAEPLGNFRRSLYLLPLPAELIRESAGSFTSFLIAGFLEFFVILSMCSGFYFGSARTRESRFDSVWTG